VHAQRRIAGADTRAAPRGDGDSNAIASAGGNAEPDRDTNGAAEPDACRDRYTEASTERHAACAAERWERWAEIVRKALKSSHTAHVIIQVPNT